MATAIAGAGTNGRTYGLLAAAAAVGLLLWLGTRSRNERPAVAPRAAPAAGDAAAKAGNDEERFYAHPSLPGVPSAAQQVFLSFFFKKKIIHFILA